jgi:spermidine synthase
MLTQRLLGLLPVALHGQAHEICVIGLGSGVTLGSALAPGDVRHADVVEISPEVVEASHLFDRENGSVLAHPAVRLIVGDGRSHLLLTPRKYDVIISEPPTHGWPESRRSSPVSSSRRRAQTGPDGLLCQWAHTYDISQEDLQSIVRTFASVFPQGTMWLVGEADLLLIGGPGADVRSRLAALPSRLRNPSTAGMLATVNVRVADAPFDLLSLYKGGPDELNRYGGNAVDPDRRPHQAGVFGAARHLRQDRSATTPGPSRTWAATGLRPFGRYSTPPPTPAGPRAAPC